MRRHLGVVAAALLAATAVPAAARDGDVQAMASLARLHQGVPHRVVFRDPYAFVAMDSGLAIYDLRNPAAPVEVGQLYLPSEAFDVDVVGNIAYVANGESGLAIVDVADVTRPLRVGVLATGGTRAVAVAGGIAYLAESSAPGAPVVHGLRTVDVSVPEGPSELGFVALPNGALDVAVASGTAFVGLGSELALPHGLQAVDVSDPNSPLLIAGGFLATGRAVNQIALNGSLAYLATGFRSTGAVVIADVGSPASPQMLSRVALSDGASGIVRDGSRLYVAARSLGLITLNAADPLAPVMLDALPTGRETVGVAMYPGFAFLAERASIEQAAFTVADASFPSAVRALSSVPFAEATAVASAPSLGYLLRRNALWIADTSTPTAPAWLSSWSPARGDFSAIAVNGTLAAIGEGDIVHLVDVTDPAAPAARGDATLGAGVVVRIVLDGATMYVVNGSGFESFDVTNPGAPAPLAAFTTTGWSSAMAIDGTTGLLVAGDTLHAIDLAVRTSPTAVGVAVLAGEQLYGVDASAGLAVATGLGATLRAFDVSIPAAPTLLGTLTGTGGFDVRLAGDRAVVAAGTAGVQVVDLRSPANPVLEGWLDTAGSALALAVEAQNVYVATGAAQHWIVQCSTCEAACTDSWPLVQDNSLQGVEVPGGATFVWQLASGSGDFNLHRTTAKSELPGLHGDMTKLVGTTPSLTLTDAFSPAAGQCGYYRIYPRASCSGASVGP